MKFNLLSFLIFFLALVGCGASKPSPERQGTLRESLRDKNRVSFSLLDQIRQIPGITLRHGVPVFVKSTNRIQDDSGFEPLYVLDGYIVGNSFRDADQLVIAASVAEIKTINGPEASFYGSRGANSIIMITTAK